MAIPHISRVLDDVRRVDLGFARALRWTGGDDEHEQRGTPDLVRILTEHLERFGVGEDGRLFRTSTGGIVSASAVGESGAMRG